MPAEEDEMERMADILFNAPVYGKRGKRFGSVIQQQARTRSFLKTV